MALTYRRLVMPLTWWYFWRALRADGAKARWAAKQAWHLTKVVSR